MVFRDMRAPYRQNAFANDHSRRGVSDCDARWAPSGAIASVATLKEVREGVEKELIQQTLKRHLGKISSAAAELGVSRPTLYELMEKLGIARWE